MNKLKFTCSYCSRIFKEPVELPCGHIICHEHLKEKNILQQNNIIQCPKCKQNFEAKDCDDFKQLDIHISDEEKSLKSKIEESIRNFYQTNEEFSLNKNLVTLECHKHFQEVRFQIDEHREELKKKIDDISLEMIERTKKYEDLFLKSLNEKFKSIETKSVEQELAETFRNPNLLIETLNEMLQRHEKTLEDIKLKVNEVNQEKLSLNASNVFKPNEAFVAESFGLLYLNDPFISQILKGQQQAMELIKLCAFSPNDKWTLLYRGSRDGFGASDFHEKCDGHSNTLTLVKAKATS